MEKRYQVFVSSTFLDLQEARQEVIQALLEQDCMPSGMELFPAADEDQWSLIKKVIDDSDYYVLVLAGRYGSIGPKGLSYTEMEYRYAMEIGKPIIGFVHADPDSLAAKYCELSDEGKSKLAEFRALVQMKMCKMWSTPSELGSQVSRSLIKLIKSRPAVGWVKSNLVPTQSSTEEILALRHKIERLETEILEHKNKEPKEAADLAKGDDLFGFKITFIGRHPRGACQKYNMIITLSWNKIFAAVSPKLMSEASGTLIWRAINSYLESNLPVEIQESKSLAGNTIENIEVSENDIETIKIQLRALGLITRSDEANNGSYIMWILTPYGDTVMTRLRAQRKPEATIAGANS